MNSIGRRYQIHNVLGEGGMGTVYRALDRLTGEYVALKRVKETSGALAPTELHDQSATSLRVTLTNEFQTLAALRHPHVINVMDYGFDHLDHPYFTMTLLDNPQSITDAARDHSVTAKVRMLVEVLQALDYLHRRNILHRDLKPDNALVDENDSVQVLDFGLALLQKKNELDSDDIDVSGTLAYMAPELLQGDKPSAPSDLYAVGVIGYELFAGEHPYNTRNSGLLLQDVMFKIPDADRLDVGFELAEIVLRLLSKAPEDRYANSREVIRDLLDTIDVSKTGTIISIETEEIRDSFLQTAPFTGRDGEFRLLVSALDDAQLRKGSAWLVGGEIGVGKTRLLDELRIAALVRGGLVLRGQGISGGGMPYQHWRQPMRRLVLETEIDDLDASILQDIIPDISTLLNKPIPKVISLAGPDYQQRLVATITSIFQSCPQPILLLLEDLQWADESLSVLERLLEITEDHPLMIVGTYRSDENPDLPNQLSDMTHVLLNRLSSEAIAEISGAMLGETGERPDVLQLLQNETEGNVYFLIEVIRVLAEEAGNLDLIEMMELPAKVAAGGIQEVMMRRLNRVPDHVFELLQLAALAGRELDLKLLQNAFPYITLDSWLAICTNCAVLESTAEQWRFSHDKLRETVNNTIPTAKRPDLHAQIAAALEQSYPHAPERAGEIAYHWRMAGNTAQERRYQREAGFYTLRMSALAEAVEHLSRALALTPEDQQTERIDLMLKLAEAHKYRGEFEAARAYVDDALEGSGTSQDSTRLAEAEYEKSDLLFNMGEFDSALAYGQQSRDRYQQQNQPQGVARALATMALIHSQRGEHSEAVALAESSLTLSQEIGDQATMFKSVTCLGVAYFSTGRFDDAAKHFTEALEMSRANRDRRQIALALRNLGSVSALQSQFESARDYFKEGYTIAEAIGERRYQASMLNNLGLVLMYLESFDEANTYLEQSLQLMQKLGLQNQVANTYVNLGHVAERQANLPLARERYLRAMRHAHEINAKPIMLESLAGLSKIHSDPVQAAAYVGLITNHEATSGETKRMANGISQDLQTVLDETAYNSALADGAALDLNTLVKTLIEELKTNPS